MAIYNIDNIRSINEDKSDIRMRDTSAKRIARYKSELGHKPFSPEYKAKLVDSIDRLPAMRTGSMSYKDIPNSTKTFKNAKFVAGAANTMDKLNIPQKMKDKARIERKLKENKAKQAKLKEAAQYILDVLDEQEYYDEYDNSNDYYYYE